MLFYMIKKYEKLENLLNTINNIEMKKIMGIKPGPKRIAKSTGEPDKRQRDNKETPGNTPTLKPHVHKKGK
jgi:hypothetical protein